MPAGFEMDGIAFTETALGSSPEHAAALGRIFTSWSLIEGSVASILGLLMHAEPKPVVAVLSTFRNNNSRIEAVRKVAKQVLDPHLQAPFDELT